MTRAKSLCVVGTLLTFCLPSLAAEGGNSAPKNKAATDKTGHPLIQAGMSSDMIVKAIGQPAKIESMKSPEGQAEVWIYRRLLSTQTMQVATGTRELPAFTGPNSTGAMGTVTEPTYGMKYERIFQVTRLLMFDGKLVASKQAREVELSYEQ